MRKQISFLFSIVILLSSTGCENNEEKNIIPKEDFVDILVDIHLMDGIMQQPNLRNSLTKNDTIDYYNAVLRSSNYTRGQFDSSIAYYSKNIKEFDNIYQDVLSTLNQMEARAEDELEEQRKEKKQKKKGEKEKQKERLGNPYKIELCSKVKVKR